jgi:hypothetical protein
MKSLEEIVQIPLRAVRLFHVRTYGITSFLVEPHASVIDRQDGYELYELRGIFLRHAYFLKYTCPSTGKPYVSGIPPMIGQHKSVRRALAWKFCLPHVTTRHLFTAES